MIAFTFGSLPAIPFFHTDYDDFESLVPCGRLIDSLHFHPVGDMAHVEQDWISGLWLFFFVITPQHQLFI
jgi:hypothetical protein